MSLLNNTLLSMFLLMSIALMAVELYGVLMAFSTPMDEEDTDNEK